MHSRLLYCARTNLGTLTNGENIMATNGRSTTLHLLNAATKKELKLVKSNGIYNVDGKILTGDLYRDEDILAIIVVKNTVQVEDISTVTKQP